MATEDVILQIRADVSDVLSKVEGLASQFEAKVAEMDAAAQQLDFDPSSESARRLREEVEQVAGELQDLTGVAVEEIQVLADSGGDASGEMDRLADSLERVNESAVQSANTLDDFTEQNVKAGTELRRTRTSVHSLEDILVSINPRLLKVASGFVILNGVLFAGQKAYEKLSPVIDTLFEGIGRLTGNQDRAAQSGEAVKLIIEGMLNPTKLLGNSVQLLSMAWNELFDAETKVVNVQAEHLALINILTKNGIDVQNKSVEELRATYEKLLSQGKLITQQALQQAEAEKLLVEELAGSREALELQVEALSGAFDTLKESGGLTTPVLQDILSRIDAQIASWERLGESAPAVLASMRQEVEALLTPLDDYEERLAEIEEETRRAEEATKSFKDSVAGNREALEARTRAILDGVAALKAEGAVNSEVAANISREIEEVLEQYKKFGIEAPAALRALGDEYEPLVEKTKDLAKATTEADASLEGLLSTAESAKERLKEAQKAVEGYEATIEELQGKPILTEEEIQRLGEARRELRFAESEVSEFANSQEALADAGEEVVSVFESQNTLADVLERDFGLTADAAKRLSDEAGGVAEGLADVTRESERADLGQFSDETKDAANSMATLRAEAEAFLSMMEGRLGRVLGLFTSLKNCLDELAGVDI